MSHLGHEEAKNDTSNWSRRLPSSTIDPSVPSKDYDREEYLSEKEKNFRRKNKVNIKFNQL